MRFAFVNKELQIQFQRFYPQGKYLTIAREELHDALNKADIFVLDSKAANEIAGALEGEDRPSIFVTAEESAPMPAAFLEGYADDIVVLPLRELDTLRLVKMHEHLKALRNVEKTSRGIPGLVKKLNEDIQLAQKIQRRLIKDKFPSMGGLSIKSKYWCGLKAGGDYFDAFEFPDGQHIGLILTDSSSYSLSTNLLGSLMQFSAHAGAKDHFDPATIVQTLFSKLGDSIKEKDQLSLFYGVLDRKTYQLRYVDCGAVFAQWKNKEESKWLAKGDAAPLSKTNGAIGSSKEVFLEPGDRLTLLSDGWVDGLESGLSGLPEEIEDAQDLLNELSFRLRKSVEKNLEPEDISEEFPMPPQDCSILVIDVAKNLLRLAK